MQPPVARAVVIGASGGLGQACVQHLIQQGVPEIYAFSRTGQAFSSSSVHNAQLDLCEETSIAAAAALAGQNGPLQLVLISTGLLHNGVMHQPERKLSELDPAKLATDFAVNTIGPALVAKHFLPLLDRQQRSLFVALSARVGSISDNQLGGWYGYRAAKAALNMLLKNAAIEMGRRNPQAIVLGYHPGTVDTPLSKPFQRRVDPAKLFSPATAAGHLFAVLARAESGDSGKVLAWDGQEVLP